MEETEMVLDELEMFSKQISLRFDRSWFGLCWITKEQEVLTTYFSNCRDPTFEKYGHNIQERMENLDRFYNSKEYQDHLERPGGQMICKKSFAGYREYIAENVKNENVKEVLLDYCDRIDNNIGNLEKIAVLTETDIQKEKENLIYHVLRHEWIHVLLEQNNIESENWKYNEGLVTYCDYFIRNDLNNLEEYENSIDDLFCKEYYTNAIMFRDLLKSVPMNNRIETIREFLRQ